MQTTVNAQSVENTILWYVHHVCDFQLRIMDIARVLPETSPFALFRWSSTTGLHPTKGAMPATGEQVVVGRIRRFVR